MKFLIVDGYPEPARQELQGAGASPAWQLFESMLKQRCSEAEISIIFPSDDETLPAREELSQFRGILWTGCNLCIHSLGDPRVDRQIVLCEAAFALGIPQFGSCWAIQIAAVAAGGKVAANPKGREMGIARKIGLTPAGSEHPMYSGKAPIFDAFICHLDEVTELPEGATLLAGNSFTAVQALEVKHLEGVFWGLQYHPEYNLEEMANLTRARIGPLLKEGFFADEEAAQTHIQRLRDLHADPGRKDLRWGLSLDEDVLDDEIRQRELINWLRFVREI